MKKEIESLRARNKYLERRVKNDTRFITFVVFTMVLLTIMEIIS